MPELLGDQLVLGFFGFACHQGAFFATKPRERLYSVFMFSLLCERDKERSLRRSLASVYTVSSCFHCCVSEVHALDIF
jgi:hypothetical protein